MALMGAWAYSQDPNRPEETLRCLRWMESFQKRGEAIEVDEQARSSVLVACNLIGTSSNEKMHIENAFGVAKQIFDELISSSARLSYHAVFAHYLQACAILDDDDPRKYGEAERCFRFCQEAGLLSTLVWRCLYENYPESFITKITKGLRTDKAPLLWKRTHTSAKSRRQQLD